MKDKIIKLEIIETSRLQLDSNVIHPFVKYLPAYCRVHFVNKNTGYYIELKEEQSDEIVYHNEVITYHENNRFETCQNNIILPFATNPCDFRKLGNSVSAWNQRNPLANTEFFINFPAH
jgi:hypothetical protein